MIMLYVVGLWVGVPQAVYKICYAYVLNNEKKKKM